MNEKFLKLYYEKYGQSSGKTYDAWLADIKRDPTNKLDQMATYLESDPDRLQDFDYNLHYSDGELYMPIEVYKNAIGVANNDPITTKAYNEKTKRNIGAYIHRIYNDITSPESDGATQPEPIPVENTEPIADTGSEVTTDSQDGGEGSIIDDNSGITPAKKVVDYKSLADPSKNFYTSAETEIINKRKGLETKKTVEKSRNESFKEKASNELAAVIPDNGPQNNDNEQNIDEDQSNAKTPENVAKIDYRYVKESIASVERDLKIKDPYKSFNKNTNALGKYQIVPSQHKADVLDVTGIDISTYEGKKSFIDNPDAQEKYMDFLMERYANNLADLQIVNKANGAQYTDEELMYLNHWQGFEGAKDSIRTKQTANPENNVELFTQLERYKKNVEENIKKYPKLKYEDIGVETDGAKTDGADPEKETGPFDNLPILDERQKEIIDSNNKSIDFYNKVIEKNKKTLSKKNTTLSESALLEIRKKNADYETIVRDLSEQNSSILDNKSTPNNEQWTPEGYKNELDFRINAVDNAQAMLSVSTDDKDISYYSKKTKQARESLKKLYENSPQELQNKGYVEDIVSDIETNKRTLGDVFRDNYDVLATVTPPEYQKALSLYKDIQVEQSEIDFQKRHGLDKTPIGLERIAQAKTNILNLQTDLNKSVYTAKESKLLAVRSAESEYRNALKTNDPNIISKARTKLNNAEEAVGKLVNSVDQSSGTVKTIQAELAEWEKQGKFRGITNNEDKLKIYLLGVSEEYAKISKLSNVGLGEMIANDLGYQDNPVYKRWQELYGKLETLTVPFLFNKDTVTGQDNDLIKLFFRGVATMPMLDKIGKERTSETISTLEGVEVPAIGSVKKSAKEQLAGDEGWLPSIESTVETVGSSTGFAAELFVGNAAMRMASIVPKAGKVLRGLDELAETGKIGGSTLFKSELASKVFGNALQSGLSYKATGLVLPKSQEELNGVGGAAAGAGEVLGEAAYEKVVGGALAAIFGPNAQKASSVLTKMVKKIGKGVGEVASEYLETIATLADENGFNQEFLNDLDAQFPDIKANTRFIVSTFMMGAIMGEGHDAGKALGQAVQEQAEKLAPDQKRIFDEAKRKVEQAKIEAQSELATEPVTDPTTEPVTEADSAPVVGSDSEPVVDSAPVAGPDSEPVVDSAPVPDPVTNPGTEPVIELSPVTNIASNVLAAMELGETVTVIEGNVPLEKPIDQEVITAQIAELKVLAENELLSREDFDKTIIATSSNKQEADNLWEAIETNPLEALTKLEEEIISQQKTKDNGPEQGTTEDTTANNTTVEDTDIVQAEIDQESDIEAITAKGTAIIETSGSGGTTGEDGKSTSPEETIQQIDEVTAQIDDKLSSADVEAGRDSETKTVDGVLYTRAKKIVNKLVGRIVNVKYSRNDTEDAEYAIVEADDLIPSHLRGSINHNHFIPEAQPRDRSMSALKNEGERKADVLDPTQLGANNIAYFGAPNVNERGEAIQGSGRLQAIIEYYNKFPNDPKKYKDYLRELATELSIPLEQFDSFKKPVLVRINKVSDSRAIVLGNYKEKDLTDVVQSGSDEKAAMARLSPADKAKIIQAIKGLIIPGQTIRDFISENGQSVLDLLIDVGLLRDDARARYLNESGALNREGVESVYQVIKNLLFEGSSDQSIIRKFDDIAEKHRIGIENALLDIISNDKLKAAVQDVVAILYAFEQSDVTDIQSFIRSIDLITNGSISDKYPKISVDLSVLIANSGQKATTDLLRRIASEINGSPADMFQEAIPPISLEQSINTIIQETKSNAKNKQGSKGASTTKSKTSSKGTSATKSKSSKKNTEATSGTTEPTTEGNTDAGPVQERDVQTPLDGTKDTAKDNAKESDSIEPTTGPETPPSGPEIPPTNTKQSLREKAKAFNAKSSEFKADFDAGFDEFNGILKEIAKDNRTILPMAFVPLPNIDPIKAAKLINATRKMINALLASGIYDFASMALIIAEKAKDSSSELLTYIKKAYFDLLLENPELTNVNSFAEVAEFKYEDYIDEVDSPNNEVVVIQPSVAFVSAVKEKINSGEKLTIVSLRKIANDVDFVYENDTDIQELVELAVLQLAREINNGPGTFEEKLKKVEVIYNNQPALNQRDSSKIEFQQYSTPVPIGFLAGGFVSNWGLFNGVVLDPSAGNGSLLVYFDIQNIRANEIDNARVNNLKEQGIDATLLDGRQPMPDGPFDAVVTNPPFGSQPAVTYDGKYKISGLEKNMSIVALQSMIPNGRAVIIIGGHTRFDDKGRLELADANYYAFLYENYNVVDIVNIDGSYYYKQGTTFPTRIIFIDGVRDKSQHLEKPYPNRSELDPTPIKNINDLYGRITVKLQDRVQPNTDTNAESRDSISGNNTKEVSNNKGYDTTSDATTSGGTGSQIPNDRGKTEKPKTKQPTIPTRGQIDNKGDSVDTETGGRTNPKIGYNVNTDSSNRGTSTSGGDTTTGTKEDILPNDSNTVPRSSDGDVRGANLNIESPKVPYEPKSSAPKMGTIIPTNMAAPIYAVLDRIGDVDSYVSKAIGLNIEQLHKALFAEQIDGVALAIYNIENGYGMILGDMTGIGKGRQLAAVLIYALRKGHNPIFMTQKPVLFTDIYNDMSALGGEDYVPFILNRPDKERDPNIYVTDEKGDKKLKFPTAPISVLKKAYDSNSLPSEYDYIMLTYSQVNVANKQQLFISKLANNNIIILDESHDAGGQGNTGMFLQKVLQNTKGVVFSSATYAKTPANMPLYATKTSLSEVGSMNEIIEVMTSGGTALTEILSRDLTQVGQLLRRERDFTDVITTWPVMENKKDEHYKTFDSLIDIFNLIINFQKQFINPVVKNIDNVERAQQGQQSLGANNVQFASRLYNTVRQMLLALKTEEVANDAIAELRNGNKPVITLSNTMASFLSDMGYNINDTIDNIDFAKVLDKGLNSVFTYYKIDALANRTKESIDINRLSKEAQNEYNQIKELIKITSSGIVVSPIDKIIQIIEAAGYKTGELTGRTERLVINEDGTAVLIKRQDTNKRDIINGFNSGKIDVIIMNRSAAAGVSMHASRKFIDQRPRVMLGLQTESDLNNEIQLQGRIDRTDQVHRGRYKYWSSAVPAEKRLFMMMKSKMSKLNALTTSSQKETRTEIAESDFLNKYGDTIVIEWILENEELVKSIGDPLKVFGSSGDNTEGDTDMRTPTIENAALRFAGHVALMRTSDQERFYNEVIERYNSHIEYLNDSLTNDLEVQIIKLNATKLEEVVIQKGTDNQNPFMSDVVREKIEVDVLKKPLKSEKVTEETNKLTGGLGPFEYKEKLLSDYKKYLEGKYEYDYGKILESLTRKKMADIEKAVVKYYTANDIKRDDVPQDVIESITSTIDAEIKLEIDSRNEALKAKIKTLYDKNTMYLNGLVPGKSYYIPLNDSPLSANSEGIFLGFKYDGNRMTPSNIKATYAVLDSRRKIDVPLSNNINNMILLNTSMSLVTPDVSIENWDSKNTKLTRVNRYMITGNIISGYVKNKDNGSLVSYTTDSGEVKQGILLNEGYKPSEQLAYVPLVDKFSDLRDSGSLSDSTGTVKIIYNYKIKKYEVDVPKSTAKGGKYFLDADLRNLTMGGNFKTVGTSMVAVVSESNIYDFVKVLTTNHKLTATSKLGNTETKQETPNNGNTQLSKASDIRLESDGNHVPATKESIQAKYPDAKVVNSVSDLPQNLKDEIAQNSSDGEVVYGLVDHTTGDIYIISDNVQTMDVADATYRHEFLGHKGVIAKLGEKLDGYAITLVDNATGEQREKIEVLSQLYFKKPINELTGNEKSLLGQEYIAFISEDSENNQSVFNRIANKIREFMRELGLPLSISDSEVKELINSIERDIESSKKKLPTANQQALEFIKSLSKKDLVELLYLSGNESINPSLVNYFNKNYDRWIKGVKVPTELIPTFKSYKSSRNRGGNILNRKISENERPSIRTTEVRSQESKGATQARRGKKGPQKEQGGERPIQKQYEKQVVEATEILSNRLGVNHWVSQLFTKAMDSIINTRITTPIPTQVASYVSDNELLPHIAKIAEQAAIVSDGYDNTISEAVMMVSRAHARAQAVDGTIPDPKLNIRGKRTAGEQITKPLLALIKKSFPGINVKIVSGLDAVAKMGTNSKAYKNVTGKIIGYFGEDGTIYLDDTEADQETLIEEYAHLWIALAKAYKGELYQSILEQAKASPEFVTLSSDPDYGHFSEDTRAEEIFAKLVASQIVKDGKVITPSTAAKFWNLIKSFLSKIFQTNFSSDLFIQKMSLMDLAKAAGKELTGGIAISQIKSTDVHKLQNNLAMSAAISPALYDMIDRGMLQKEKAIFLGVESPFITKAYQYVEQKVFPKYSMGEVMNRLTKLKASKAKAAIFKANANSIKVKKSLHAYFVAKYGKQYSTINSNQVAKELSLFNRFLGGPDKISESELDNLLKIAIPMLGPGPSFLGEYTQLKADILDMRSRIDTLSNKLIEEGLIYKDGLVVQLNPDLNTIIQSSYEYYDFIESSKILLDKEYEKNRVKIAMMDDTQLKEEIERLLDERARGKAEITFNKLRELDFSIKFIKMTNMINVLGLSMTKESLIAKLEELKGAYKSPNEKTRKAAASAFNSWAKSKFAILNNQADLARAAVTLSPAEIDLLNDIDLLMQQLEDDGSTGFNLRAYALKLNSDVSKLKKTNLKFNEKVKYVKGIAWNKNVDGTYQIGFIHGDASKQYANNVTVEQLGTIFGKDMVDYIVAREKGIRMYKKERSISSHAMFHKIRQNIGMYVTRSYAKYDNKARAKEALMAQPSSLIGKARSIIIKSLTRNRDIVSLEIIPDPSAPYTLNRLDQGYLVRFKNKYGLWSEWQKTTLRDLGEKTNTSGIINASDIASINGYLNTKNRLVYNLRYKAIGGKEITFPLSVERQEELLIQLLENEKADSQQQQASEDKLRVNVKEFWKRKDLSKAFRVLIGEYKDPYINSLKTLTKMEAALAHLEWENQILAEHGSRGFRKEDNPPKNTKKWKPLTREMSAGLFDQGYRWVEQSVWYSYYQENSLAHLNGVMGMLARLAAYASGVLALTSPKSQNRNFLSGIFIALRNGMISYKDIASAKDAMIISGAETEPGNFMWLSPLFNILRKLIGGNKYGIAQEGFNAKNPLISDRDKLIEVFAILKEENLLDGSVDSGLFLDYINSKDDQNIFELMLEKASLVNQSADNFWKVLGFLKEYRTYRKAYPGLSNQEVIRKAAQITRDTWPVYGELPDWVKDWSSKIPFFGQFVMYKSAIIQNYARTFNIIKEEMASGIPALRGRARQRIFGLTADIAFKKLLYTSGISVLGWLLGGDDDDDDEKKAIAMLDRMYDAGDIGILEYMNKRYIDGPKNAGFMGLEKPYNANKDYVLLNVSKESVTYLDLSYVDPSSYLISIFNSYLRKENQPGLNVLLDELLNSYTDEKYLYKLTREAMNGETEFGDRIYDVNDAGAIKAFNSITHISGSMVPLITYDVTTIGKGLLGMAAPSGDPIVLSDELVSMFIGLKVKTKSPIRMIRGNFYESANTLKDQAFALKQGILTQKKNKGTIPDILAPAVNVVLPDTYIKNLSIPEQKKIRKEYALREVAKLQGWVKDMYTLGFTRYDIEQAVDDIRFPSEDAFNIDFKNEIFK